MKEVRYDSLGGLSAPILIFDSIDEAEKAKPGALLEQANSNLVYRGVLPAVRDTICNIVEAASGIERQSKVIGKTKAGKDILEWEAEGAYVKRVLAEKNWKDLTQFQTELDNACRNFVEGEGEARKVAPLAVDFSSERKAAGPKKLAAKFKAAAAKVLHIGNVDAVNTKQLAQIGKVFTPSNDTSKMFEGSYQDGEAEVKFNVSDKDAEALGWMIKEYLDFKAAETAKQEGFSL